MTLFHSKPKEDKPLGQLKNCCKGKPVRIEDTKDEIIATSILGEGYAVVPLETEITSPLSGRILDITNKSTGILIKSDDGLKVLVHFSCKNEIVTSQKLNILVRTGDCVTAGQPVAEFDCLCESEKYVYVIITNSDELQKLSFHLNAKDTDGVIADYSF